MVTTHELKGTKAQIADQIQHMSGNVLSALVLVDEPSSLNSRPVTDAEFAKLMAEMDADAVSVENVDYSREAMYTRMPGE